MISIREILAYMETRKPFSCTVVSFDERRPEKSGRLIEIQEAILVQSEKKVDTRSGERPKTALESVLSTDTIRRDPKHRAHYTRNVRELSGGQPTAVITKIHPPLLLRFNGQIVVP